ncbi:MAG: tetratricopeptide repeat protein [Mariprofundaceae bacterium]|nr:tetratricopeptide repeat protein [Mariprofundaceae bacterium]
MSGLPPKVSGVYRGILFVLFLFLPGAPTHAQSENNGLIVALRHQWAHIKYQLPKNQRKGAFRKLYARARQIRITHPGKAEPLLWEGIILTDYAGERGGLKALQMIKQSRKLFEKALKINPYASHGAAYTQLGNLYFEVPGWPLGFGDRDKARSLLKKGLSISPDGLDTNYFMGKFLLRQKKHREAARYFQRALAVLPRPGRMIADTGRKSDARRMLEQITQKLKH